LPNGKVGVGCCWHYFWLSTANQYEFLVCFLAEKFSFQT
jgi:hypothetical protein